MSVAALWRHHRFRSICCTGEMPCSLYDCHQESLEFSFVNLPEVRSVAPTTIVLTRPQWVREHVEFSSPSAY
eukprot:4080505-Amphidinium_carterae.1